MPKIEHLAIWTSDLESMRDFYCTYFDGRSNELYHNKTKGFRSYFISFEDGTRLELMHMEAIPENENSIEKQYKGIIHFAFSLGKKEKVDLLTETLRIAGYEIVGEPRTTGDGYYESCILDPEGNRVEITA